MPPSTTSSAPATKLDSSHARKSTAAAISLGSAVRPTGIWAATWAMTAASPAKKSENPVVAVGLGYALQRYAAYMDVYEKGILLASIPGMIWLGWFWRPLRALMLGVAVMALLAIGLYQGPEGADLARSETVFGLKYFLSSQSAILWMSVVFFISTVFYWIGMFAKGDRTTS